MSTNVLFDDWMMKNKTEYVQQISDIVLSNYVFISDKEKLKWDNILSDYLPLASTCLERYDLYKLVAKMLLELKDPHTRFRYFYDNQELRVILREYKGKIYIIEALYNNSNILRGDELISINGVPISKVLNELRDLYNFESINVQKFNIVEHLCQYYLNEDDEIEFLSNGIVKKEVIGANSKYALSKELNKIPHSSINMLPQKVFNESVLYLKLVSFMINGIEHEFELALKRTNYHNLLIDVRGNTGGLIEKTTYMTAMLLENDRDLGYTLSNSDKTFQPFIVKKGNSFLHKFDKVVILADKNSGSSTENIFLRGLKGSSKKITVVGTHTMGLTHQGTVFTLKDNTKLSVTTKKYFNSDREILVPKGIEPDIHVEDDFLSANDEQLNVSLEIFSR